MMSNLIDAEQLLELFQTKPSVVGGTKKLPPTIEGKVEFDHVNFGYDGKKQTITDLSFQVAPGKTIALIGETGGGKSTILKLLFRFYDITSGSLRIDDHDIRELSLESLRERIGVVPQDPSMFNDTIMSNLRYARLDATNQEIEDACKAAAVHDKIMTFTDGYQSKVGEYGVRLSGGELQRIAIARAILKNPSIILLDEATSSVDSETEGKIQEALKKLSKDRTTFIVAHRLSTIMDADLILVIKDGQILEQGAPAELMKTKGKYYSLWIKQMGVIDPDPAAITEAEKILNDSEEQGAVTRDTKPTKDGPQESVRDAVKSDEPVGKLKRPNLSREPSSVANKKALWANAPEFVPHRPKANARKQTNTSQPSRGSTTTKATDEENSSGSRKRKPRQEISTVAQSAQVFASTDGINPEETSSQLLQSGGIGTEPKAKRSRFNRRHHSKSEPASPGGRASQGDRASEISSPDMETGKGKTTNPPGERRSSAPTTQVLGSTNWQNSSNNTNRRRRRWRLRNRDPSTSHNSSKAATGGWSTSSTPYGESSGPTNTPVNGIVDSKSGGLSR